MWAAARPALAWLHEQTGESVQLFVRDGDARVCVESIESPRELRTIVPVGARLPLSVGSAGRVLERRRTGRGWPAWRSARRAWPACRPRSATAQGRVVAAVSVSGPLQRLTRKPGQQYGALVAQAAAQVERASRRPPVESRG